MGRFFHIVLLISISCGLTAGAQVAHAAHDKEIAKKFAAMDLPEVQRLADTKHQYALLEMAVRYFAGNGVEKDIERAIAIVTDLANRDNDQAMYMLGAAYANGLGVGKDDRAATDWFARSARRGNPLGQYWYAQMIGTGRAGGAADWKKALPWLKKSAAAKNSQAAAQIGFLYERGLGVRQSANEAAKWYRRANALEFNPQAQWNLSLLIEKGLVTWKPGDPKMSSKDINVDQYGAPGTTSATTGQ